MSPFMAKLLGIIKVGLFLTGSSDIFLLLLTTFIKLTLEFKETIFWIQHLNEMVLMKPLKNMRKIKEKSFSLALILI